MKQVGYRISAVLAVLIVITPPLWCAGSIVNAYIALQKYAEWVFSEPLPPRTEMLDQHMSYVSSGSSSCVGYVSITIATELSAQALQTYYSDPAITPIFHRGLVGVHIDEDPMIDGRLQAIIDSYGGIDGKAYSLFCNLLRQERN